MNNQSHRLQMINAASNRKCVRDEANRFNSTMKEPEESTWTDAQHFKNKEGNTSRRTPKNKSCYLCAVKVQKAEQCQRGCSSNFLLWRQKMPKTTFNCSTSLLFSSLLFSFQLLETSALAVCQIAKPMPPPNSTPSWTDCNSSALSTRW